MTAAEDANDGDFRELDTTQTVSR